MFATLLRANLLPLALLVAPVSERSVPPPRSVDSFKLPVTCGAVAAVGRF